MINIIAESPRLFNQTKFFLFKYLLVALLLFLHPIHLFAIHNVKISPPQEKQSVIYVSPNTVVHGLEHFTIAASEKVVYVAPGTVISGQSNLIIRRAPANTIISITSRPNDNHQKVLGISKNFVAENKAKDKSVQELQKKIQYKALKAFYSKGYSNPFSILNQYNSSDGGILSYTSSSEFAGIINYFVSFEHRFDSQYAKQNFCTPSIHIPSSIISTNFLRGPPERQA